MPDLLIRDLKPATHDLLKRLVESSDSSIEAQLHEILDQAANTPNMETARALAEQSRARFAGRIFSDSADLIREIRDHD